MKKICGTVLTIITTVVSNAADISGYIMDSNNHIKGATIKLIEKNSGMVVCEVETSENGQFELSNIIPAEYIFKCSYKDYPEYNAIINIENDSNFFMGEVAAFNSQQLDEVVVVGHRDVFTAGKQSIYPSVQQIATSGGGLDLLKKLPIPLLDINLTTRTISSLDAFGGVAVLLNDIPIDANELSNINPNRILRVDVIRKPGLKYGENLALAINIVLKNHYDGVGINLNTTNSAKLISGNNSVSLLYIHKNSEFSLSQNEVYRNSSHQSVTNIRQYLMPNNTWHSVSQQSLSMKESSYAHNTTFNYNLTLAEKLVFQARGYFNYDKNPVNYWTHLVKETGEKDFMITEQSNAATKSSAINLYLKNNIGADNSIIGNIVGTWISTNYVHNNSHNDQSFSSQTCIKGKKLSLIGEVKYTRDFAWGSLCTGLRTFLSNTNNRYMTDKESETIMTNANSSIYSQIDYRFGRFIGDVSLSLDSRYYKQGDVSYDRYILSPHLNLYYMLLPTLSLGYGFNLSPRIPSLSALNDVTIQNDKWERSIGNSLLKPFNHIENSLSAAYYKSELYAMVSCTSALNRGAIMPTVSRTELEDGSVVFDNGVRNQNNMLQWVISAYLRYALLSNKLIFSINGSYSWYDAKAETYTNSKGFIYGNLSIESYIGKFYISANINSRYNSLFAETIWFNEYSNSINATYNWRSFQVGLT